MKRSLHRRYLGKVLGTLILGALLTTVTAKAQFYSPAGTWDFVISGGGQQGVASIQFFSDNTFSGHEILVPRSKSGSSDSGRGTGDPDRTPTGTNSLNGGTNLFGYSSISGQWFYDVKGKVIGNYSIVVGSGSNAVTKGVSFTGKVTPGKRFTLLASASSGKLTFKGVPFQQLTDLSSFPYWYGYKTENKQTFIEVFTLTPMDPAHGNVYWMDMSGDGPGYSYESGVCIASVQKKIGFVLIEEPTGNPEGFLRATVGSFLNTPSNPTAKTKGVKEPDSSVKFDAAVPTVLP